MGLDLMPIPILYVRSSSYNSWENCQFDSYLSILGRSTTANKKAASGNILHKSAQLLALQKLAQQQNKHQFDESELGISFKTGEITVDKSVELAYNYYERTEPEYNWTLDDLELIKGWVYKAIEFNDGIFNPANREIIAVEQFFDLPIEEEWAKYSYTVQDKEFVGQLRIKGTIDLILKPRDGSEGIETLDWKSGKYASNWATGELKTQATLFKDPQLKIYHLALSKLFPEHKNLWQTLFYVNAGGPLSDLFTEDRIPDTLLMLKKHFEEVKDTELPTRIINDKSRNWKCFKLCKWNQKNPKTGKSWCNTLYSELEQIGIDKFTDKFVKMDRFGKYNEGGGRSNVQS